jgi:hypothetical protein
MEMWDRKQCKASKVKYLTHIFHCYQTIYFVCFIQILSAVTTVNFHISHRTGVGHISLYKLHLQTHSQNAAFKLSNLLKNVIITNVIQVFCHNSKDFQTEHSLFSPLDNNKKYRCRENM